jgi:hypothetical protein
LFQFLPCLFREPVNFILPETQDPDVNGAYEADARDFRIIRFLEQAGEEGGSSFITHVCMYMCLFLHSTWIKPPHHPLC